MGQCLDHRGACCNGRHTGFTLEYGNHLLVPAGPLVETAGGTPIDDQADAGSREIARAVLYFGIHSLHTGLARCLVGNPHPLPMDTYMPWCDRLKISLTRRVRRWHNNAYTGFRHTASIRRKFSE